MTTPNTTGTNPTVHHPYNSLGYGEGFYGVDFVGQLPTPIVPVDDVSCPPTTSIFDELFCQMKRFFESFKVRRLV